MADLPTVPAGFLWGAATSACQVEGATTEDGRGPSVWDTFCRTPGHVLNGDSGDVACDHYHRWREDVALMRDLGLRSYRFSVSWPRVLPEGKGAVEQRGLDFYRRLVDGLLEAGIAPCLTLYHWDLPQALEDEGGWPARDTAYRFADYATVVAAALGDRVALWATLNEPIINAVAGYRYGGHAPGRTDPDAAAAAGHHLLLAHGLGARALRAAGVTGALGIVNHYSTAVAASTDEADVTAAGLFDDVQNHSYTDPVLLGRLPDAVAAAAAPWMRAGDPELIAAPIDFLGVNYYAPARVRAAADADPPYQLMPHEGVEHTGFGWPVVPAGLHALLVALRQRYGDRLPPLYVTENGAAYEDVVDADGQVDDPRRVAYLDAHVRAVAAAIADGVDVRGYFVWSLLDNFEWSMGYSQRFGLVYVDYPTQRRSPKASYRWYRDLIARSAPASG